MKKRFSAVVVSAALAVTSAASIVPFGTFAEVTQLFDDTFETGYNGWAARGDSTIEVVDTASHSGDSALYITGRTKAWHGAGCAKIKELCAGQSYDLSAWVMFETGNDTEQINFSILYKDANGTENYKQITSAQVSKGVWTNLAATYTIPADATNITLYFETPSNLIDFYIDDITAKGEPSSAGTMEGFSDNFTGSVMQWSGRGDAKCSISTGTGVDGGDCLFTQGRTSLWNGPPCNKTLVLNAGNYYRFSGWVKYEGADWTDTQSFTMNMQFQQDGAEKYIEIGKVSATKGEWAYLECEYTIPSDASNLVVYFQTAWKPDASVTSQDLMDFYIDDVSAEVLDPPTIQDEIASLKEVYSDLFRIGCASTAGELEYSATQALIKKHYNSLTLGNELKPDSCLNQTASQKYFNETGDDTNPQISLANAKSLLDFAAENNIDVRGHVLVWHSQTPDWFFKEGFSNDGAWVSKDIMNQRLENYIKNIMTALAEQYPTVNFYAWDVVNEAFTDQGNMREAGSNNTVTGQSAWMQVYGDDSFIDKAFEYARKYAPDGCKLFYNDYNEYTPAKRDAICEKAAELKEKGLIDGIGMQSHISMGYPTLELYEEAIRKYDELGLEVQVTELDVSQKSNTTEDQLLLAKRYQDVFKLYKSLKNEGVNLTGVIIWGITDNTSWIGGYPLLFDKDYQAKPAFYAVADTDEDIKMLQTANAVEYDGTAQDMAKAFEVQKTNTVGEKGEFKLAWNGNKLMVNVTTKYSLAMSVKIKVGSIVKSNITSGTSTISMDLPDGFDPNNIEFDIAFDDYSWNNGELGLSSDESVPGKVILADMPKYAEAVYGTPTIDGTIDAKWEDAPEINIDTYTLGTDGATGTSKMMWDENYIYILTEVKDAALSKANANAYEQDTVEVFFDENNAKTNSYETDDIQTRINYDNEKTVTDGKTTDAFISATSKTSDGYLVEVAIPSTLGGLSSNQVVGFDVQINDDDGSGERTGIANWSDTTGLGYMSTAGYGVLKLIGEATLKYGDANVSGKVDVADVVAVRRYLVNPDKYPLTAQGMLNADVQGNGNGVNAQDAVAIQKSVLGMIDLPIA